MNEWQDWDNAEIAWQREAYEREQEEEWDEQEKESARLAARTEHPNSFAQSVPAMPALGGRKRMCAPWWCAHSQRGPYGLRWV